MDDLAAVRSLLGASVVFQHLAPAAIDAILAQARVVQAKPGELLLTEGTPGDGLYVVLEGEVEVFLPQAAASGGQRPTPVRLNRLGPGRCFGEYGVVDDEPSSASVAARDAGAAVLRAPTRAAAVARARRRDRPRRLRQPAALPRRPPPPQGPGRRPVFFLIGGPEMAPKPPGRLVAPRRSRGAPRHSDPTAPGSRYQDSRAPGVQTGGSG